MTLNEPLGPKTTVADPHKAVNFLFIAASFTFVTLHYLRIHFKMLTFYIMQLLVSKLRLRIKDLKEFTFRTVRQVSEQTNRLPIDKLIDYV